MARPRKNRLGEHAQAFAGELERLLSEEMQRVIEQQHAEYMKEITSLRREIQRLGKQVEVLSERAKQPKPKVGKWVPGGPGRPPKDATDRIAAFEARTKSRRTKKK